jgi:hypothetical protein
MANIERPGPIFAPSLLAVLLFVLLLFRGATGGIGLAPGGVEFGQEGEGTVSGIHIGRTRTLPAPGRRNHGGAIRAGERFALGSSGGGRGFGPTEVR